MKGKFIAFEGIDRSGKSTQAKLLCESLKRKGVPVILTHEPGATHVGEKIREIILDTTMEIDPLAETFLFEADRIQHVKRMIKPAIESGTWVISDRFFYSTMAYQHGGKGVDKNLIETLNSIATDGIEPDIVFLIDISPSTAMRRKGKPDRMEMEGIKFLNNVRNAYLEIAKHEKNFIVIDGEKEIEEIQELIWKEILKRF